MRLFVVAVVLDQQEDAVAAGEVRAVALSMTRSRWAVAEAWLAAAAFVMLGVLVLRASPYLPEPDDVAYRASIVGMTHGHFFTLSGRRHKRSPSLMPDSSPAPPVDPQGVAASCGCRWAPHPEKCISRVCQGSDLPSIDAHFGDGLDGRHQSGLNPAEGAVGTADAPRELRQAPPTYEPDKARAPVLADTT